MPLSGKRVERRLAQEESGSAGEQAVRAGKNAKSAQVAIHRKLALAFAAAALVLLVGVVSVASVRHLVSGFAELRRSTDLASDLRELAGWFLEAESGMRGFLLTGDERYVEQHAAAMRGARGQLAELEPELEKHPGYAVDAPVLRRAAAEQAAAMESLLTIAQSLGRPAAVARVQAGVGRQEMDSLRTVIQRLADADAEVIATQSGARERDVTIALFLMGGGGVLAFLFLAGILAGVRRDVRRESRLQSDLLEHAKQLDAQTAELEMQNEQLQEQAVELEEQSSQLEAQQTELEAANDELLRANAEAEAARERFRLLLESADSGVFGIDENGYCTFINPAGARILGYDYPELVGKHFHETVHHTRADGTPYPFRECPIAAALTDGRRVRVDDEVYWRRDGSMLDVDYTAAPLTIGSDVRGAVVTFVDITARKRDQDTRLFLADASAALNSSLDYHETLRTVAELAVPRLADWCVVDMLEDGVLRRLAMVHSDPDKLQMVRDLSAKRPPRLDAPIGSGKVITTGTPELYAEIPEAVLIAAAAGDVDLIQTLEQLQLRSMLAVPFIVRGNAIGAIVCVTAESRRRYGEGDLDVVRDLAARASLAIENALLYREAEEARARAETADRAKSQFLAAMSHELRTPLNAIGGYAELVSVGVHGPINDKQREALERITRSQKALLSLINDILNFSKLQAGFVQVSVEDVPAAELLDSMDTWIEPQLRGKKLKYDYEPCDPDTMIRGDREKIQQVMLNLLSNAVKFTPAGGRIIVRCTAGEHFAEIAVSDTGPGIPPDKLETIFEPFVQVDREIHPALPGTGLGLAISRDLARAMSGDVRAKSEVGKGSVFVFTIPRVPARTG